MIFLFNGNKLLINVILIFILSKNIFLCIRKRIKASTVPLNIKLWPSCAKSLKENEINSKAYHESETTVLGHMLKLKDHMQIQ